MNSSLKPRSAEAWIKDASALIARFARAFRRLAGGVAGQDFVSAAAGEFDGRLRRDRRKRPAADFSRITRTIVVPNLAESSFDIPHREELLSMGLHSCLAIPLMSNGSYIGAALLHADGADAFDRIRLASIQGDSGSWQGLGEDAEAGNDAKGAPRTSSRSAYLRHVDSIIASAPTGSSRLLLQVLDIAGLAIINGALSHDAGDTVLRLVAERLQAEFKDHETVCHLGGGSFAVCQDCRTADAGAANALRKRVEDLFEAPFSVDEHDLRLAVKSGFAQFPEDGTDAEDLLNHAETALGHAKQAGERYLRHRPAMNEAASTQLSITNRLRAIVAQQDFVLNYQPKVFVGSGAVDGVEALLRWPGNAIPPNVFIPIVESIGLIEQVGRWVIDQSLSECATWFEDPRFDGFRVAVNVSPLQLRRGSFADDVLALLDKAHPGLANRLELEVTESMIMADPVRARTSLERLRDAGMTVAIDDFGTGHSSLRVLTHLPVDVLKIDRCFVKDLPCNRRDRLIVQAAITLAKSLGMKTVAEGVETQEQACVLQDLGCDVLQGYLIHRPAPADEIGRWLSGSQNPGRERDCLTSSSGTYRHIFRTLPTDASQRSL